MLRLSRADAVKAACLLVCLGAFLGASLMNVSKYLDRKTTITTTTFPNERLRLPAVTFCNRTSFKTDDVVVGLEEYLANTVGEEDLFEDVGLSLLAYHHNNTLEVKGTLKPLYAKYKGRCFTYTHPGEFPAVEGIMVDLKFGAEVKFAVHEPGEEFWLHLDYAIGDPLHINIYDTSTDMSDSRITKEIRVRVSGCADWTSADYYSCIRKEYRRYRVSHNFPNCTTPWALSIMGLVGKEEEEAKMRDCRVDEIAPEMALNNKFMIAVANPNTSKCLPPCVKATYRSTFVPFGKRDGVSFLRLHSGGNFHRPMFFYYPTTDVTLVEETRLMTGSDLVSAIGGNLGLFLGFSVLSVVFGGIRRLERKHRPADTTAQNGSQTAYEVQQ